MVGWTNPIPTNRRSTQRSRSSQATNVNGSGNRFSSTLTYTENPGISKPELDQRMTDYLGIESWITNRLNPGSFGEDFFDAGKLEAGYYTIRVFAADFFDNQTYKDIPIEVVR